MKILFMSLLFIPLFGKCQIYDDLDNRINGLTTIVESRLGKEILQGTGFFYYEFSTDSVKPNSKLIKDIFLVTNRHIIFHKDSTGQEHVPDNITFYERSFTDSISWSPVTLSRAKFAPVTAVHTNPNIDVAVIEIFPFLSKHKMLDSTNVAKLNGVYEEMIPNKNLPRPQASDDVIIIGYPKGYYDHKNLFPIVKRGIIASKWGAHFNNNPYFLIDGKLFPASSGSLVLSKPTDFTTINGQAMRSPVKQYTFLGIYSGELFNEEPEDIGIVWYGNLIKEIIDHGVSYR